MRLIDADALKESMGEHPYNWNDSPEEIQESFDWDNFMQLIDDAPTIDVVPVRHGHWIDKPTGKYGKWQSYCSACGKHSQIGGIESNRHKPRCPWCGAFMDEVME